MGINSVGTDASGNAGKAKPPVPSGLSEEQGAQAIAALLSPRKREDTPASKRDAAPAKKPVKPEPNESEQSDEEEEGESDDDYNIEVPEVSDESDDEAETPNDEDEDAEESEDDEVESREEDDEDDSDDQESLLELDPAAKVKHPKTGEILTVQELLDSRLRTADYTRKTQELAKLRKEAEPELKAVREERKQLADSLKQMEQALKETTPQEPNWDEEFQNDPDAAAQLYARWDIHKKRMAEIAKQREDAEAKVLDDFKKDYAAAMQQEGEQLEKAMGWDGNAEKAKAGRAAIFDYGKSLGFEDQQLHSVNDHRLLIVMDKARRWDEAQKKGKGQKAPTKPVVKPGPASSSTATPRPVKELNRAKRRVAETGNIHDGKHAISLLLQAERAPTKRRR